MKLVAFLFFISPLVWSQEIATVTSEAKPSQFNFNPLSVKRDPFTPPELAADSSKSPLEYYDLAQLDLLAVMSGAGASQAMLALPNGETHIVQVGDKIGRNKGRVFKITTSEMIVKETYLDPRGKEVVNLTPIVIKN